MLWCYGVSRVMVLALCSCNGISPSYGVSLCYGVGCVMVFAHDKVFAHVMM